MHSVICTFTGLKSMCAIHMWCWNLPWKFNLHDHISERKPNITCPQSNRWYVTGCRTQICICYLVNRELVRDREAWCAAIHGVAKSRTGLSNWSDLKPVVSSTGQKWKLFSLLVSICKVILPAARDGLKGLSQLHGTPHVVQCPLKILHFLARGSAFLVCPGFSIMLLVLLLEKIWTAVYAVFMFVMSVKKPGLFSETASEHLWNWAISLHYWENSFTFQISVSSLMRTVLIYSKCAHLLIKCWLTVLMPLKSSRGRYLDDSLYSYLECPFFCLEQPSWQTTGLGTNVTSSSFL